MATNRLASHESLSAVIFLSSDHANAIERVCGVLVWALSFGPKQNFVSQEAHVARSSSSSLRVHPELTKKSLKLGQVGKVNVVAGDMRGVYNTLF